MPPSTPVKGNQELNQQDRLKFVKDAIFHVITQEAKRPLFKRHEIMSAIGLNKYSKDTQTGILAAAIKDLKEVFGYDLKELVDKDKKTKNMFILVNTIEESQDENLRHLHLTEKEEVHLGLLTVVLSVIYMNNNSIKEENLFSFLESLDLCDKDPTKNNHPDFGNIKTLIDNEWCKKHHYIHMDKDADADPDQPMHIYSWGERALVEIKKSEILKFVAEIYEKNVTEFTDQYETICIEEGEDVFADDE